MTLVEFIAPLRDAGHREKVLAVLYYEKRYRSNDALTAEKIHRQLIGRSFIRRIGRVE